VHHAQPFSSVGTARKGTKWDQDCKLAKLMKWDHG
jgi:hypothetical protein